MAKENKISISGWYNDGFNHLQIDTWDLTKEQDQEIRECIKQLSNKFPYVRFHVEAWMFKSREQCLKEMNNG